MTFEKTLANQADLVELVLDLPGVNYPPLPTIDQMRVHQMRVPDGLEGDKQYEWRSNNEKDKKKAREMFEEKIKLGWSAYKLSGPHDGEVIHQFDEHADLIILSPPRAGG